MTKYIWIFVIGLLGLTQPVLAAVHIQTWSLDNGAKVYFVENHTLPMVDVSVNFDAGSKRDPENKMGLAGFTNRLLSRGTQALGDQPARTEAEILDRFAYLAAPYRHSYNNDSGGVAMRVLSEEKEQGAAIQLLAQVLAAPNFPEDVMERSKKRTILAIQETNIQPDTIAAKKFYQQIYGSHPYGGYADAASISSITQEDLIDFHRKHYVANHAIVSIVGDISKTQAQHIAQQLTEHLPQGESLPMLPDVPEQKANTQWIAHPAAQAHIMMGQVSVEMTDPDYVALVVGNYILGSGGFVSRLMHEVREKRGLAYSVGSGFSPMMQKGPFVIALQTKKEQAAEALEVTRQTLKTFIEQSVTQKELQAAKDYLIGSNAFRLNSNGKILDNIEDIGIYHLPLDFLETWPDKVKQVTEEQVKAAFAKKVHFDELTTIVVGPAK